MVVFIFFIWLLTGVLFLCNSIFSKNNVVLIENFQASEMLEFAKENNIETKGITFSYFKYELEKNNLIEKFNKKMLDKRC